MNHVARSATGCARSLADHGVSATGSAAPQHWLQQRRRHPSGFSALPANARRPRRKIARPLASVTVLIAAALSWSSPLSSLLGGVAAAWRPRARTFVGGAPIRAAAAPALAPATTSRPHPGLPARIDERRFSEKVRWHVDEDVSRSRPPAWHVLLLDKTFQRRSNTVERVAAILASTLPLNLSVARARAAHARDNFFSMVHTESDWAGVIQAARELQSRGLVVRVTPGATLTPPATKDGGADDAFQPVTAASDGGRRSP
mmetsp:Transcript_16523/g.45127  ORF Transcript_16523/g.45127 Transcript_16523/m.45127 type:complete len:259 (+) Transcript_16523:125-901(+)|eukprot:CAMPEP_0117523610 /NCGR_PEP_ID=MMETSP0784-20121206/34816_1 /TAXON_ID=39447 /ORGANISM="" /LENGTH=258 /DNA_ID=CAMNT_0005319727 /DNA_START=96 /DNA_END=872 /DNA_ORIENTATION=+